MAEGSKPIRLSKIAKEFNIGISTIADFLLKKGHAIEAKPNSKIEADLFELLVKEFQSEKAVKQESLKIGIDYSSHETISIDDEVIGKPELEFEFEPEEFFIKNISGGFKEDIRKEDLSEPKKETEEKVIEVEEKEIQHEIIKEEPVISKEEQEAKEETKKDIVITDEKEAIPEISEKEESRVEVPKESPQELKLEEKEIADEKKEIIPESLKTSEKTETKGLKVLGKIDIEKTIPKPKAKRKAKPDETKKVIKEELKKEDLEKADIKKLEPEKADKKEVKKKSEPTTEKTDVVEKESIKSKKAKEQALEPLPDVLKKPKDEIQPKSVEIKEELKKLPSNFIPTEFTKLSGPTIVDKIILPEKIKHEKKIIKKLEKKTFKKKVKEPIASSVDEKVAAKKKKRKRIHNLGPEALQNTQIKDERQKGRFQKGVKPKKEIQKAELTEEEVQRQIKETLARLSPSGKSKGSKHRRIKRETQSKHRIEEQIKLEADKKVIKVTEFVTANELASMINVPVNQVIATCMTLGIFVSINQRLDAETLSLVSEEFGYKVDFVSIDVQEAIDSADLEEDNSEDLVSRPPVITVMGHVDHGKTLLLDHIRKSNVIAGEAGGITQHIGAYEVTLDNGRKITFLDTPGHEAFTAMRARGAKVTDIAIIIIAADDNVMPQTKEAINHAQAAGVPMVFAINKIDKSNSNPEKIKEELAQMNILVEDWGGKFQSQDISAKIGTNVRELIDKILLEAEMLELKGNPIKKASGTVIESALDKGRGYVTKLLVQNGTLKIGDIVLAGSCIGKVKAMYNERNILIKEAGPSSPLLLLGLNGAPQAGDEFNVMKDEKEAKSIATKRLQLQREQGLRTQKHITLDEIGRRIAIGDFKELNIIVKGDVDGSIEALSDSLLKLSNEHVQVNIIHKSVGQVTETDVLLASASNAIIIGFQVRPSISARKLAEKEQIDIRLYSIIYQAIEEIKAAIEGMLSPDIEEKITSNVEIREIFKITKVGTIAGCMVLDGKITRNTKIRVIRDGIVVYTGSLGSLKRFKDDVKEVQTGFECGLNIENFNDIKVRDIIEGYEEVEVKRKL
ncbi:MAG: translation initiation factor IF-2 [Bacteroidales bacterium]|nr:translation initiation factor IF-2 [Bacteroidales bacterium]